MEIKVQATLTESITITQNSQNSFGSTPSHKKSSSTASFRPNLFNNEKITKKDSKAIKPEKKFLPNSEEESFSEKSSSSSENFPIKKPKVIEDELGESTIMVKKSILKLINIKSKEEFKIKSSSTIGRQSSISPNHIKMSGDEISKEQCKINTFGNGYTINDNKSTNGTFLKIKKNYNTVVYNGMMLNIGDFLLTIYLNTRGKSIKYTLSQYEDEENKEENETQICVFKENFKIFFGKNPGGKNDIKINDPKIDDVEGYLEKLDCIINVKALNEKGIWLKAQKEIDYVLSKNMELKFAEIYDFKVENCPKLKINKCKICNVKADLFFSPCKHNILCSECGGRDLKKCPECFQKIKKISINYDLVGIEAESDD